MLIAVTKIYCPNRKVVCKNFLNLFFTLHFRNCFFLLLDKGKKDVKVDGHFGNN